MTNNMQNEIDDPTDPRLDVFLGLRDHHARQQREQPGGDMAGNFIAEGVSVIERGLAHGYELTSVLCDARRADRLSPVVRDTNVLTAKGEVLTAVTGRPELRDPLACFVRPTLADPVSLLRVGTRFAVLEGINNPNNLGVIMRNAAALGVDAVLLDPTCADPLYRRAIRSSMGQVFAIPHARIGELPDAIGLFREHDVTTIALTPSADVDLRDLETPGNKIAVLLGAEGPGLTSATMQAADLRVRIEMSHDIDSLNVANAAAIAFWVVQS